MKTTTMHPRRATFVKYWAMFATQLSMSLAYPIDLLGRSVSILIFMLVFYSLWRAAFASAGQSVINGLDLHDTLWYLLLAEVIVLSKPRIANAIATSVKDGSIGYLLNKPYNFIGYQLSIALGESVLRIVSNALIGGALVWWLVGPPPPVWGWPLVLVVLVFGWLIDFCIAALIGLTAFVTEEIAAFEWIYAKVLFLLGGLLIPLDFFPDWLRSIASVLPFAAAIYGPARLFVEPDWTRFGWLLLTQLGWIMLLGTLLALLYRRCVGWLTINGG